MIQTVEADFQVRLAQNLQDLQAAQRLRYDVFVRELGAGGDLVDHVQGLEQDALDPFYDHLLLIDKAIDEVVGVYRVLLPEQAQKAGRYYSASEYDLAPLVHSGRRILELGRSCLHKEYRGGLGMHQLWSALATYILENKIEVLFGVASFHGTDIDELAPPLSLLHHRHLAPEPLRVRACAQAYQRMDLIAPEDLDRKAAMMKVPSLIKAYLRLGGCVGEGAFIDHDFNTTDVCLIMDTTQMSQRQARMYRDRKG